MSAFGGDSLIPRAKSRDSSNGEASVSFVGQPGSSRIRFCILCSTASFMFGNFYFFDQTSATQAAIIARTGMTDTTFGLLSSVYSWPNVVLPLFGGLLIDRVGVRASTLAFTGLVTLGSLIFTVGLWQRSIALLVMGRLVFGFGGESQNVASLTIISRWFAGKELAFAMAVNIAVSRLGSVAVFNTQPQLVSAGSVTEASLCGLFICLLSFGAAVCTVWLDWLGERRISARTLVTPAGQAASGEEVVNLSDCLSFGRLFWLVALTCVSVYVAAFPFLQVTSTPYLQGRFGFDEKQADFITSLPNLVSAFASPIAGLSADRWGQRPMIMVLGTLTFIACNAGLLVYPACYQCWSVTAFYVVIGMALSLFGSVIWPCIPLVTPPTAHGTAMGLTTAMQNLGMALSPLALSYLHGATASFTLPFLYIIACCLLGLGAGVSIWITDRRGDRTLSRPGGGE
mmetsp:Transcript_75777/g.201028  ORF Transcript_75777/g.201028 Transcript_75777/m.201028 type:complete len:456 (-) Transcript_75777:72-1439(-)